jgi:hypothetical protein
MSIVAPSPKSRSPSFRAGGPWAPAPRMRRCPFRTSSVGPSSRIRRKFSAVARAKMSYQFPRFSARTPMRG